VAEEQTPAVRASDAEREQAAAVLRDAATHGRLTLDELAERADGVYTARTRSELDALVADLPAATAPAATGRTATTRIVAVMSGVEKTRRWRLAPEATVIAVMGGVELDLRRAEIEGPEVELTCIAIMGGIEIVVPEGVEVELTGFAFMGGKSQSVRGVEPRPGAPLVRVRAFAVMGGIDVSSRSGPDRVPDRLQLEE
jgi:uncharacterized protein DUF1707/cell wall-active antibiotic response 4TMS protein YvqF